MSDLENYLGRAHAVVWGASDSFADRRALEDAYDSLENGEPAEAIHILAWAIVNEQVRVPRALLQEIETLTASWVQPGEIPPDLLMYATENGDTPPEIQGRESGQ